jgi:hypothetical protein
MECAGVAAGSKIFVGESAQARRALASKPTKADPVLLQAVTRFSAWASLANRFVTLKGTGVASHRSRLFNEYRLERQA